jgi:class 3 adenylate cyclase
MKLEVLTIVFVDIKDYTSKTSDQSRQANQRLLARFAGLVKPMVRVFNGTLVKSIGDAYLITFKSPTDSLLCAMAVQDQLAGRNPALPKEERFELRFAINAGEVRIEKADVFGEAVNIAARIEGLAKGGEVYFSEAVYLMMNKSEVPYEAVGRHKLKGIAEEVGVYRIPKLREVGAYKLALAEDERLNEPAAPQALPFGGLALKKVHTHLTGQAVQADGAFYLGGAFSELHYAAGSRALQFGARGWWAKGLVPAVYAAAFAWGGLRLALSPEPYRGAGWRARRALTRLQRDAGYRRKALRALMVLGLLGLTAALGFLQYQALQQARAYKALAEQKAVAAREAAAREAATEKALSKEKKRMHFPW